MSDEKKKVKFSCSVEAGPFKIDVNGGYVKAAVSMGDGVPPLRMEGDVVAGIRKLREDSEENDAQEEDPDTDES
jgi:hypothetical protein